MKIISGHQPQYLAYNGLIQKIIKSDAFVIVNHVQYKKKEWQNRNRIYGKNGVMYLTVPVLTKNKFYQSIDNVKINNDINWQKKHFKSIFLTYKNTEYFSDYKSFFENYYLEKKWEYLSELNIYFLEWIFEILKIQTKIYISNEYEFKAKKNLLLIEICKKFNADCYLSGQGAKDYVDEKYFEDNNLEHKFFSYKTIKYIQSINQKQLNFIGNLSIIDMLFNCGTKKTIKLLNETNEL